MENRRNVLGLLAMVASAGTARVAGSGDHLCDDVVSQDGAKFSRDPFGEDTRVFFEGSTAQLKSMTAGSLLLKAGMEPDPPHQHPEEEIMIVTTGSGEILAGGKQVKVEPGSMMYCESNQLHGIKNTGSEPLLFYYLKWMA